MRRRWLDFPGVGCNGEGLKERLDKLVVGRGLAPSRERARALIMAGKVEVEGQVVAKAGAMVDEGAAIGLKEPDHPWVSRGGIKLAAALDAFGIDPGGMTAMDVGASTGGFTDVLLQRGARKVFAIDVGYGQLDWKLRNDERVVVMERQNIRRLEAAAIDEAIDLAVIDVSFISLTKVLESVAALMAPAAGKSIVCLIKPQFEVGKGQIGKGGVVRDPEARARAVESVCAWARDHDLPPIAGPIESPITGPAGNVEYLVQLRAGG
jgi:23S rRNA (cytidine1920-2'-O)/16S rRNA (cytidine1409-2'-O)-methyltransferase